jgi:hypothetical protein
VLECAIALVALRIRVFASLWEDLFNLSLQRSVRFSDSSQRPRLAADVVKVLPRANGRNVVAQADKDASAADSTTCGPQKCRATPRCYPDLNAMAR